MLNARRKYGSICIYAWLMPNCLVATFYILMRWCILIWGMWNGHQELALVYLPPHHLLPRGLIASSIGRASHRRCEVVGSIPTQVPIFFFLGKRSWDLHTSATAYGNIIVQMHVCSSLQHWSRVMCAVA